MKKFLAVVLAGCMLLGGCGTQDQPQVDENAKNVITGKLSEYVVMKENTAYVYRGDTTQVADYTYYVEYTGEGILQRQLVGMNETMAEVLRFDDKTLSLEYTESHYLRRENLMERESNFYNLWIGAPLKEGAKWSCVEKPMETESSSVVTAVDVPVTVPYGEFTAIEITKTYADEAVDLVVKEYYAKGVGLVKTTSISNGQEISSELAEMHENVAQTTQVPLFYMENGERVFDVWELAYKTNDDPFVLYNKTFPKHFAEKFGIAEEILHIEGIELEYAETSTPVMNIIFNGGLMMQTIPTEATKCMVDTLGYLFGEQYVRFISNDAILLIKDVGQSEDGVMEVTPIEASEGEFVDASISADAGATIEADPETTEE